MTSSLRARASVGIAALLLTGLLAGCNDEKDPPDASEPSSEPVATEATSAAEPTTTPTGPVEPTLPAAAKEETKAGAEAFVEYYWDVVNYAQATGDTDRLKNLSIRSCAGCNGGTESIAKVYRRGGRIIGGRFSVIGATVGRTPSGAWNVSADIKIGQRRVIHAGSLNEVSRAGVVGFLLGLDYPNGSWVLTFLDAS